VISARVIVRPPHRQDHHRGQEHRRHDSFELREGDRQQAEGPGQEIELQHRRARRARHVEQPVVHVLPVRGEDRRALAQAAQDRQRRVHQWDGEGHERYEQRDQRDPAVGLDREQREQEAHQQRARVAQEDARRREVVRQEAQQRAGQGDADAQRERLTRLPGEHRQRGRHDRRHSAGQAVEPVEQVEGVRDGDDPEGRRHPHEPARQLDRGARERVGEAEDLEAVGDHEQRRQHLEAELRARAQAEAIVHDAQREDHPAAQQQPPQLGVRQTHRGELGHGEGRGEARRHRQPPEQRHVLPHAHLALVGSVHGADAQRQPAHQRRAENRHAEGDGTDDRELQRFHRQMSREDPPPRRALRSTPIRASRRTVVSSRSRSDPGPRRCR
jgi:hypothetical protein